VISVRKLFSVQLLKLIIISVKHRIDRKIFNELIRIKEDSQLMINMLKRKDLRMTKR